MKFKLEHADCGLFGYNKRTKDYIKNIESMHFELEKRPYNYHHNYYPSSEMSFDCYITINSLDDLLKLSKAVNNYQLIIDFEYPIILIYDGYIE